MSEKRIKDEEIEALLRKQARRMPSERLWERLQNAPVRRRRPALIWAGAMAVAAGVVALCVLRNPTPTPPRTRPLPPPHPARSVLVQNPPAVKPEPIRLVCRQPSAHRVRRAERMVLASTPRPLKPPARPAAAPVGDESTYYLEVSRSGERSILRGLRYP